MKSLQTRISRAGSLRAPSATTIRASILAGPSSRQVGRPVQQHSTAGNKAAYSTQTQTQIFSRTGSDVSAGPAEPNGRPSQKLRNNSTQGRSLLDFIPITPNRLQSAGSAVSARASYSTTTSATKTAVPAGEPIIHDMFEPKTGTFQYVVVDPSTSTAVIIDPVLDYDPATQAVNTQSADALLALVKEKGYKVDMILETHAHADHLTASTYLQRLLAQRQTHKPPIGIGKRIGQVQKLFSERYEVPRREFEGIFDKLFDDDEKFHVGNLEATALHLPGHTPDHLGYKIGDNVFCGDSIFHSDIGTARCDFPGGSASDLYESGRKLLALPDHVKIWTGHDYPPEGRATPVPFMTVQQHKEQNKHLKDGITEQEFVALRQERDAKLAAPRLLHQSLQVNIRAGRLPGPSAAGLRLLRLPLKLKTTDL